MMGVAVVGVVVIPAVVLVDHIRVGGCFGTVEIRWWFITCPRWTIVRWRMVVMVRRRSWWWWWFWWRMMGCWCQRRCLGCDLCHLEYPETPTSDLLVTSYGLKSPVCSLVIRRLRY